jgi:parallel beta-helix repeat protein
MKKTPFRTNLMKTAIYTIIVSAFATLFVLDSFGYYSSEWLPFTWLLLTTSALMITCLGILLLYAKVKPFVMFTLLPFSVVAFTISFVISNLFISMPGHMSGFALMAYFVYGNITYGSILLSCSLKRNKYFKLENLFNSSLFCSDMKKEVMLIILLLIPIAAAECTEPTDGMAITQSMTLCGDTYDVPNGITIAASDVVLDCGTGVLRGVVGEGEIGVRAENVKGITIRNCNIVTFTQGLYLKNVTNSLIEKNGFLKNRIGVRMLDSYENTIRDNNDKSFQLAVSAISSKYNIVMLGNKEIERQFCEVNACNEAREMNVCESGDFYCSKKCNPQNDADCASAPAPPAVEKENATEKVEKIIEETKKEVQQEFKNNATFIAEKKSAPIWFVIYGFSAIMAIIAVIVVLKKKK